MKSLTKYFAIAFFIGVVTSPLQAQESGSGDDELRMNFRGVPLDLVLDYLSDAAGFTIVLETQVSGTVDAWSNRPISKDEAIDILNSALNKNGYAAIRNGNKLTVVSKDEAIRRNIPVRTGNRPDEIPNNAEMVTQIVPVRYINAAQLIENLEPLKPDSTKMTANEGGNSLVITDTQENIRRFVEIVAALDTAVASVSTLEVFPLQFADATQLAETINDLFEETASGGGGDRDRGGRGGWGGFAGFGRGGGDNDNSNSDNGGLQAATQVTAVADEHSNSLIVAAPEEYIPMVEELIASVDTAVQDVTEVRVFHLQNSDPAEMADLLTNLFPDPESSSNSGRGSGIRFGGGPFGGITRGGGGGNGNNNDSDRAKKQTQVLAVADARTSSIVVSASRDMMDQIAAMIKQLDSSTSKKQKVYVYHLENSDVTEVEMILRNLFEGQNTRNTQTTTTQNALDTRAQNAAQSQGLNQNSGFGNSGFGGGGGAQGFR